MNYTSKVFIERGRQVILLPKEFRLNCDEVIIRKQGDEIFISPIKTTWDQFFEQKSAFNTFAID